MQSIQDIAREMSEAFQTKSRDNGDNYVTLRDGSPEWMGEVVRGAHDDMLPDDFRYQVIREAVDAIADAEGSRDDIRDELAGEFADDVDIYNHDLTAWLGSHSSRPGYCDEALNEFGRESAEGVMALIGMGQYMERREVFDSVLSSLEQRADTAAEV